MFHLTVARFVFAAALLAALGAALGVAEPASAGTFTVSKIQDTNDGVCDTDCSLREAIVAANADPGLSTITVPPGVYQITIAGLDNASQAGDFDITSDTSIVGAGVDLTVIDGNGVDTVVQVISTSLQNLTNVTISDLTVRGGNGAANPFTDVGGIFASGDLTLDSVRVTGNSGGSEGAGGIVAEYELTVKDSLIDRNSSGPTGAGGLTALGNIDIEGTTISDNESIGPYGVGGASFRGTATLSDVTISGNSASGQNGTGGLHLSNDTDAVMSRVRLTSNSATADFGVGGFRNLAATIAVDLEVASNAGGRYGEGGVHNVCCSAQLTMADSTVSGNTAQEDSGGGVWNDSEAALTNVTISGNSGGARSTGGLYNSGDLTLTFATITDNDGIGGAPGGVLNDGTLIVINSIVAGNTPDECNLGRGTLTSGGGNLDSANTCVFGQPSDHADAGDPNLAPLANYGGFTETHRLLLSSPAVDAANGCASLLTDQRGQSRPAGSTCDSGAFELQPSELPIWGDVTCDVALTVADVMALLKFVASGTGSSPGCAPGIGETVMVGGVQRTWGDNDCDGKVSGRDALFALLWIAESPAAQPPGCPALGSVIPS